MAAVSSHTSSRCLTESATGTHGFVVVNYSLLAGPIGSGKYVSSAHFTVGGYHWILRFYPDGYTADYYGQATSVFLCLCNGLADDVQVKCSFSLVDRDGKPCPL
ncbi:hypothetical protein ACQ4PT_022229 [Festuca glaucescens]